MGRHLQSWEEARASLDEMIEAHITNRSINEMAKNIEAMPEYLLAYPDYIKAALKKLPLSKMEPYHLEILGMIIAYVRAEGLGICFTRRFAGKRADESEDK